MANNLDDDITQDLTFFERYLPPPITVSHPKPAFPSQIHRWRSTSFPRWAGEWLGPPLVHYIVWADYPVNYC